ncbi:hypothetical protein M970_010680 [Encephalitozoon cuniculi EcunIII-L]|uniref:PCI domain-containing protein n=1 Tax=Encephalitozoon cuniculi TaxID=6035 RepID=M1KA42_ENCCN|nr:hypothetical protein ECU01_0850 [Encephalitozoon cuniculi]KMV66738.1 hypothetical protein M970_010680 [Encephalitozoon cuniculi EcunIII-L]UYI28454.1 putative nuclear mRNA export protein [Encephalitozoon cuniculi]
MGWVETTNSKIDAEDGEYISQLFGRNADTLVGMKSSDLGRVKYPFNALFEYQKALVAEKSYSSAEVLVKNAVRMLGREKWASTVVKRAVYGLLELKSQDNLGKISKLLTDMHKKLVEEESPAAAYVGNALLQIHLDMGRFKSAEDFLRASKEPDTRCRDYHVFHYYRGIIKMHEEDFREAYLSLKKAFMYKRWRKIVAPVYFISSLFVNKFPKDVYLERFGCSYLSGLVSIVRGGLYEDIDDAISRTSEKIADYNLCRTMAAHYPLVCFNNLVGRIYRLHGCDSRLDIQRIVEALPAIDFKEIICLLSTSIGLGRLKGYISISRRAVVFSRADPFPVLVK